MNSDDRRQRQDPSRSNHHQNRHHHQMYPSNSPAGSYHPSSATQHSSATLFQNVNQMAPYDPSLPPQSSLYSGPGSSGLQPGSGFLPWDPVMSSPLADPNYLSYLTPMNPLLHPWDPLMLSTGNPTLPRGFSPFDDARGSSAFPSSPTTSKGFSPPGSPTSPASPGRAGSFSSDEKRIRNTEASARFRARKRQKNQELQRTISALQERADELERNANELRRENTWLKELAMLRSRTQELLAQQAVEEEESDEESVDPRVRAGRP
ncbi:hypothetical protein FRC03_006025 [Tulasnella sp. 419]|nr:hypothetical protein FRC02_009306 [Tulasnella sp. 418]KAG8960906.1 hypothetical protein FRC03_006025 [Tulasnella sp. 419]